MHPTGFQAMPLQYRLGRWSLVVGVNGKKGVPGISVTPRALVRGHAYFDPEHYNLIAKGRTS